MIIAVAPHVVFHYFLLILRKISTCSIDREAYQGLDNIDALFVKRSILTGEKTRRIEFLKI